MRRVAVFVDAGYLWVQLSHIIHGRITSRPKVTIDYPRMHEGLLHQVATQFNGIDLLRVYWYDGPGAHGKTQDHTSIEDLDDFKLRLGTRNGAGDQKAVDGLIIADMIAMAQSKAISDALLISGDADLTPGVAAAQNLGIRIHLLTMGPANATSPYLKAEVDFKAHWDDMEVKKFASASIVANTQPVAGSTPAVSPAVSAPQPAAISATWMDEAASFVLAKLDQAQFPSLTKVGGLPKDVDTQLLREGCKRSGLKTLDEEQKRTLRAKLRSKIPSASNTDQQ